MICSNASSTCTDPKVCSGSGHIQPISSFFHKNPRVRLHIRTSPFPPAYWVTMGEGHTGGDPAAARNPCSLDILSQNRELTGWGGQREEVQWDSSPSHSPCLSSPCQPRETHKSSNLIPLDLLMLKKTKTKKPCSVDSLAWQLTRADVFKKEVAVWEFNIMWKKREGEGKRPVQPGQPFFLPLLKDRLVKSLHPKHLRKCSSTESSKGT